uniref:WRN helicase interacting protein 1 n=1 Tax=Astyanax mexicanus TaxID=7994 RepID=A0A8B9GYF4_ASTMX
MAGVVEAECVKCPVCGGDFEPASINAHLDECLLDHQAESGGDRGGESEPPAKKVRVNGDTSTGGGPGVFSLFQNKPKVTEKLEKSSSSTSSYSSSSSSSSSFISSSFSNTTATAPNPGMKWESLLNIDKPLAEKLRPSSLEEYFGQNKVVGEQTLMRSLLQSQEIPSLIFWGPPGCACLWCFIYDEKKCLCLNYKYFSYTYSFLHFSFKILFYYYIILTFYIDRIKLYNTLYNTDTFLPHVECGTITLIGATTENPSFQVNSALLSRCRVLVLEKLSVEAMGSILLRAVDSLGLGVLPDDASERKRLMSAEQRCSVILAQCAVYLSRAPKSIEIYTAYNNVKACLRNHKGPLPSVPLHLRNAPTKLMKELGYAKGYKYNPKFNGPVDQEYLPEELRGTNFFTWKR